MGVGGYTLIEVEYLFLKLTKVTKHSGQLLLWKPLQGKRITTASLNVTKCSLSIAIKNLHYHLYPYNKSSKILHDCFLSC